MKSKRTGEIMKSKTTMSEKDLKKLKAWIKSYTHPVVPELENAVIRGILHDCTAWVKEVLDETLEQVNELIDLVEDDDDEKY